jgi:uncharacterized protein YndB with AHSA1/START domain
MVRKILLVVLVLVAALLLYIATRPDTFHVERTAVIHAPADVVFARIEDLHRWPDWSAWEKLDPAMRRTFSGADKGVGAVYAWKGNDKVGEGRMTIVEATAPTKLDMRLEFLKPFAATNSATFDLTPQAEGTQVRWSMDGKQNFMSKAMCLVVDMDKEVGGDFEKGLAALDSASAADVRTAAAVPDSAAVR